MAHQRLQANKRTNPGTQVPWPTRGSLPTTIKMLLGSSSVLISLSAWKFRLWDHKSLNKQGVGEFSQPRGFPNFQIRQRIQKDVQTGSFGGLRGLSGKSPRPRNTKSRGACGWVFFFSGQPSCIHWKKKMAPKKWTFIFLKASFEQLTPSKFLAHRGRIPC